jgi:hypothetical protein
VNGRGILSETSQSTIWFEPSDAIGATKTIRYFVKFAGNPSVPSDAILMDVSTAISMLSVNGSAYVQIIETEIWTQYIKFTTSFGNAQDYAKQYKPAQLDVPIGVWIDWHSGFTGSTMFTRVLTTDSQGNVIIPWTVTSVITGPGWTAAGPPYTTTVTVASTITAPSQGYNNGTGWWDALKKWFDKLFSGLGLTGNLKTVAIVLGVALIIVLIIWIVVSLLKMSSPARVARRSYDIYYHGKT